MAMLRKTLALRRSSRFFSAKLPKIRPSHSLENNTKHCTTHSKWFSTLLQLSLRLQMKKNIHNRHKPALAKQQPVGQTPSFNLAVAIPFPPPTTPRTLPPTQIIKRKNLPGLFGSSLMDSTVQYVYSVTNRTDRSPLPAVGYRRARLCCWTRGAVESQNQSFENSIVLEKNNKKTPVLTSWKVCHGLWDVKLEHRERW